MTMKRNDRSISLRFTCMALLVLGAPHGAAEKTADEEKKSAAEITRTADASEPEGTANDPLASGATITATEIKFPGLTIDRKTHEVRMDATVCLDSGILEYLVCLSNTHEHESIFVTKVKPEFLHTALLLTGHQPAPMLPGLEDAWWGKALKAEKSRVRIDVEWEIDGIVERANITSLIRKNTGNHKGTDDGDMPRPQGDESEEVSDAWVFSGSSLRTLQDGRRVYEANASGIIIGIWPNPTAVIQYGKPTKNPYRGANQGMVVNENVVPKEGTQVQLVFLKHDALENVLRDE